METYGLSTRFFYTSTKYDTEWISYSRPTVLRLENEKARCISMDNYYGTGSLNYGDSTSPKATLGLMPCVTIPKNSFTLTCINIASSSILCNPRRGGI